MDIDGCVFYLIPLETHKIHHPPNNGYVVLYIFNMYNIMFMWLLIHAQKYQHTWKACRVKEESFCPRQNILENVLHILVKTKIFYHWLPTAWNMLMYWNTNNKRLDRYDSKPLLSSYNPKFSLLPKCTQSNVFHNVTVRSL